MERTITLPDDLVAQIEGAAAHQGKKLNQWLEEALRSQLEDRSWHDLLEYGRTKGQEPGYSESDVSGVVRAWRREQRQ